MIVRSDTGELPLSRRGTAVTIGKFAGVHVGHQEVLRRLVALAHERGLESTVVTFDRHPAAVLAPERAPAPLTSDVERFAVFERLGVDLTVVIRFDEARAAEPAEHFVERLLVHLLNARLVLVGSDFRFGAGGVGDIALLRQLGTRWGFEVLTVDAVTGADGRRVSSSLVRRALDEGDIELASACLGRFPRVSGVVVHGFRRGRELGFPTANVDSGVCARDGQPREQSGYVPADGVYAGWLEFDQDGRRVTRPSAISVGTNPTFEGERRTVEAYVLDEHDLDLYGQEVSAVFGTRIRDMHGFESLDALVEEMHRDVERTRAFTASRDVL